MPQVLYIFCSRSLSLWQQVVNSSDLIFSVAPSGLQVPFSSYLRSLLHQVSHSCQAFVLWFALPSDVGLWSGDCLLSFVFFFYHLLIQILMDENDDNDDYTNLYAVFSLKVKLSSWKFNSPIFKLFSWILVVSSPLPSWSS